MFPSAERTRTDPRRTHLPGSNSGPPHS